MSSPLSWQGCFWLASSRLAFGCDNRELYATGNLERRIRERRLARAATAITHQRWTVRRKAAVIEAIRGGWLPIEEACELYNISVDEFLAWERDMDRHGIHGLRTTRYQIYRDTDAQRA